MENIGSFSVHENTCFINTKSSDPPPFAQLPSFVLSDFWEKARSDLCKIHQKLPESVVLVMKINADIISVTM